jgi:hypothetical protein
LLVEIEDLYPKNTIMVVLKLLYGVPEAGMYWWATYSKHHKEKLSMEPSTYDPCLLISIVVCTDSFSLYECLVKLGTTKEKRLMIDIMALRQLYERRKLYEIR